MPGRGGGPDTNVDTLVVGAGQAGLATSYWLTQLGVEHQVLERRDALGGAWQDRWDSFYLNTPNFSFLLPGRTYDGPDPDAFLPRDAVIDLFRDYAQRIAAPVQLGTETTRIATAGNHFSVETTGGHFTAENVVLANGAFQRPRIPAASAALPGHVLQLHSHEYRNPQQRTGGAKLYALAKDPEVQAKAAKLLEDGKRIYRAATSPEAKQVDRQAAEFINKTRKK